MDLIAGYDSDDDFSLRETKEIGRREVRQVYLVTYSQADTIKFPTRESFADAVVSSFRAPSARVLHWCCSKEPHKSSGVHYHLCLKLNKSHRWLPAKNYLKEQYNISVHSSKEDHDVIMSEYHPDLRNSAGPSTMKAHLAKVEAKTNRKTASLQVHTDKIESSDEETEVNEKTKLRQGKGKKRLRAFDVAEICVAKSIKTRSDLLALAHEQKMEGKTDLAEFIINRGDKIVDSTITTAWEMENATEQKTRLETSRLDLLRKAGDEKCICNVENEWLETATSLLQENHISPDHFANCVRLLLEKGRGK